MNDTTYGYLHQLRQVLLWGLEKIQQEHILFSLHLEMLDDVEFETTGSPTEILQVKHRCNRIASLADDSQDLWEALRVWLSGQISQSSCDCDGTRSDRLFLCNDRLLLITKSDVVSGSIASKLLYCNRDEPGALKLLEEVAEISTDDTNQEAYALFKTLSDSEKRKLLHSVIIAPKDPEALSNADVSCEIRYEEVLAFLTRHRCELIRLLEEWWFRLAFEHIVGWRMGSIFYFEIDAEVRDFRQWIEVQDIIGPMVDLKDYGLDGRRIRTIIQSVIDCYRDFFQPGACGGLLDQTLHKGWVSQFRWLEDDLGEAAAKKYMRSIQQKICAWVEACGWDPEFVHRLKPLLAEEPK